MASYRFTADVLRFSQLICCTVSALKSSRIVVYVNFVSTGTKTSQKTIKMHLTIFHSSFFVDCSNFNKLKAPDPSMYSVATVHAVQVCYTSRRSCCSSHDADKIVFLGIAVMPCHLNHRPNEPGAPHCRGPVTPTEYFNCWISKPFSLGPIWHAAWCNLCSKRAKTQLGVHESLIS